jgi:hypothetical protein
MTEPIRYLDEGLAALDLPRGVQYVVRETDAERCEEIAGEFYPNGEAAAKESVEPAIEHTVRETSSMEGSASWHDGLAITMPRRRC